MASGERRYLLFTSEDSHAFWLALLKRFHCGVCTKLGEAGLISATFHRSPGDVEQGALWLGFPDSSWQPILAASGTGVDVVNLPERGFSYQVSHEVRTRRDEDATLWEERGVAQIEVRRVDGDPHRETFIQEVLECLDSVSSSRLASFDPGSGEAHPFDQKGFEHLIGFHAARWTLGSDKRLFFSRDHGAGALRPLDESATQTDYRRATSEAKPGRQADIEEAQSHPRRSGESTRSGLKALLPNPALKTRTVFFSREDSHAFGEALKAEFPFVAFCSKSILPHLQTRFHVTLGELMADDCLIYLSEETGERSQCLENPTHSVWTANPPRWRISYGTEHDPRNDRGEASPDGLILEPGLIAVQFQPGNTEELAFAERIMAIVDAVSTAGLRRVSAGTGESADPGRPEAASGEVRAGLHAAHWCLKDERRVFSLKPGISDEAYRPIE